MMPNRQLSLLASAVLLPGLAACGGNNAPAEKPAETASVGTAPAVETAPAAAPAPAAATQPATATLASLTGDVANGEKVFGQCKTCHVAEKGVNRIGPSLWSVVGRPAGSIASYTYSAANKNSGITWTAEKLFSYLEAPQKTVPGTKMTFAGLKKPQDRADVIAWLKTRV
jgi:cytochrome c